MKINENQKIIGNRVILVPYKRHHVPKYHEWMSQIEIQELTASEPLTLDEEYDMQAKWQQDNDKLTFIVLSKDEYMSKVGVTEEKREIEAMVGDVNCFIIEEEDDQPLKQVELEVMIVNKADRCHGYGSEAIFLMMNYVYKQIKSIISFNKFVAKIGEENLPSIKMFEKLGFVTFKYIKPFKQVCLMFELNMFENSHSTSNCDSKKYTFTKEFTLAIQPYDV